MNDKTELQTESSATEGLSSAVGAMIQRPVMFIFFHLCLKFLIKRNYRLRAESALNGDNKHPDKWYWADLLAVKYGYFVKTH
jgi:hypothetical protein